MREIWISLGFIGLCGLVLVGSLLMGNPQSSEAIAAEALSFNNSTLIATAPTTGDQDEPATSVIPADADIVTTDSGLQYVEVREGEGAVAEKGQIVFVNYEGKLEDGKVFDSSYPSNRTAFSFPLGRGRVIKGWDEGVAGMKVGGERLLIIPQNLAYGDRGVRGVIPPKATLIFKVELLDVQ